MIASPSNAGSPAEITRNSGSTLAFALRWLPRDRRADMRDFYAFCRVIDDLADDPTLEFAAKRDALDAWRAAVVDGLPPDAGPLARAVARLIDDYALPPDWFSGIIDGCAADLHVKRYADIDDLLAYCYRVASLVGLVSARIFGCTQPESDNYATNLGFALQLTNILRDVGADLRDDNRIYLPAADMARFSYTESDLRAHRVDARFRALMECHADRADAYFAAARAALTDTDRRALRAAEAMRRIYQSLLRAMRRDGFHVFATRYRLSRPRMLWCLLRGYFG